MSATRIAVIFSRTLSSDRPSAVATDIMSRSATIASFGTTIASALRAISTSISVFMPGLSSRSVLSRWIRTGNIVTF